MPRNSDMNRILMLFEVERIRTLKRKVYESALAYQSYCDTSGACEKRIEILMDEVITQEEKFFKKKITDTGPKNKLATGLCVPFEAISLRASFDSASQFSKKIRARE